LIIPYRFKKDKKEQAGIVFEPGGEQPELVSAGYALG
jgi:hypothetical protein